MLKKPLEIPTVRMLKKRWKNAEETPLEVPAVRTFKKNVEEMLKKCWRNPLLMVPSIFFFAPCIVSFT